MINAHSSGCHSVGHKRSGLNLWRFATHSMAAWRQRRALTKLTSEQLNDIGLTREAAQREASKPLWNVPHYWLR